MSPRSFLAAFVGTTLLVSLAHASRAPRTWAPNSFAALTPERIAALPNDQRPLWQDYWNASERLVRELPHRPTADASPLHPLPGPPKGGIHTKGLRLNAPASW